MLSRIQNERPWVPTTMSSLWMTRSRMEVGGRFMLQRLPMVAVVPRDVDAALGSGEEQAFARGIFADGVDGFVVGQAGDDLLPGLAAVVGAVDIRMQVVEAEAVDGSVGGCLIEMRGVQLGDFAPRSELGRRDVLPVLAAIARDLDQAIVGSGPDQVGVFGRWRDGIDHAAMLAFGGIVGDERAEGRGNSGIFTSQVGADDLPTVAAVAVAKSTFDPRYRMCGSTGEKISGAVRLKRYLPCAERRAKRRGSVRCCGRRR
jgi:hypothetical protein